jgi:hypothetical protein
MAVSIIGPKFYAWDSDTGAPLAFGKVFTYQAGTNTPKATFQREDGVTENANPVILNGAGYADIYLIGSYKIVVKDADDVEVWTSDPVTDPSGLQKEWINERAATQVSPTSFSIVGNHTDVYTAGKALQLDDASYLYGYVDSVTYVGGNTVVEVLSDDPLTGSLTRSWTGIVGINSLPQALPGSSESLQDVVSKRVIRVTSIAAMEAYSAPVGYVFSLNAGGRSGTFDVVAGDFSTELAADTLNGIYIGLSDDPTATSKVVKRVYSGLVKAEWFGVVSDGSTDDSAALKAALDTGFDVSLPAEGTTFLGGGEQVTVFGQRLIGGTVKKSSLIRYGIIMSGVRPEISGVRFRPDSGSGQPNTDIKVADGCIAPSIKANDFYNDIAGDGALYSAILFADGNIVTGTDFPYSVNVKRSVIDGNTFEGYTRPIYLLCADNYSITNNSFTKSNFDAIRIRETIGDGLISNNQFLDIGQYPPPDSQTRDAIDTAFSGYRLVISNNIIRNTATNGIDVKGIDGEDGPTDGYASELLAITGNMISGCWGSGISVSQAGDGFIVSNNIVTECNQENITGAGTTGNAGIVINRNTGLMTCTGNFVGYNYGRGIFVARSGAGSEVRGCNVTNNTCINNTEVGLQITAPKYAVITGNIAENRAGLKNPDKQTVGIGISGSSSFIGTIIFNNNVLKNNTAKQLSVADVELFFSFSGNIQEGAGAYSVGSSNERWNSKPKRMFSGNGVAPVSSSGTFQVGDIIWNVTPVAGGEIGIVCVTAGTPGVWKSFGAISV